jgi:UDP-glucuronate 4-epimerase
MTNSERFLVTGALGCIGAWTVKRLAGEGTPVIATDIGHDAARWRLLDPELERSVPLLGCDVTDGAAFQRLVADQGITHVVHLAALQVPFARANPTLGARVNVEGMAVVLETARQLQEQVRGLAFASSIAVFGPSGGFEPATLYGAYKLADEWMARVYDHEYGVRSIGLRPAVVYGAARDQGLTSSPTLAMQAAALGRPYHVTWGGVAGYQHAGDVAAAFIAAARACADGAGSDTYTLPVETLTMDQVLAAIQEAAGGPAELTYEPVQLPFPSEFDAAAAVRRLGGFTLTPLAEAVRDTLATFRAAAADGPPG